MHDSKHLGKHSAKIRDALVANPEFLNSGMLGGEDPSLSTVSKAPPQVQGGVDIREHSRIQEFGNTRNTHVVRSTYKRAKSQEAK